jgi:hypothetical protein
VSEASEPPSDVTWKDRVGRVELGRSRYGSVRGVEDIRASLHDMPTGPTREEFREGQMEEQSEESERKRLQRETDQRIEKLFLFSQHPYRRVEPLFDRDGFLFPR